jgi:hypothetical protein
MCSLIRKECTAANVGDGDLHAIPEQMELLRNLTGKFTRRT